MEFFKAVEMQQKQTIAQNRLFCKESMDFLLEMFGILQ